MSTYVQLNSLWKGFHNPEYVYHIIWHRRMSEVCNILLKTHSNSNILYGGIDGTLYTTLVIIMCGKHANHSKLIRKCINKASRYISNRYF